jgi:ABC-type Na+ efflux pump permease subunit
MDDERQISREVIAGALVLVAMVSIVILSTGDRGGKGETNFGGVSTQAPERPATTSTSEASGASGASEADRTTSTGIGETSTTVRSGSDENDQWMGYKYVADPAYAEANGLSTIPDGFKVAGSSTAVDGSGGAGIGDMIHLQSADVGLLWMTKYAGLLNDGRTSLLEVTDVVTLPAPTTKVCLGCANASGSVDANVVAVLNSGRKAVIAWRAGTDHEFTQIDPTGWQSSVQ